MIDPAGFAENLALRKESARRTLRAASTEDLRALVGELFSDTVHPFYEPFSNFIEEHRSETAVRGETSDGIAFVYYPRSNQGMWYMYTGQRLSVGLLGTNSLKALYELTAEAGLF
jgi:carboxylesterase type B